MSWEQNRTRRKGMLGAGADRQWTPLIFAGAREEPAARQEPARGKRPADTRITACGVTVRLIIRPSAPTDPPRCSFRRRELARRAAEPAVCTAQLAVSGGLPGGEIANQNPLSARQNQGIIPCALGDVS